MSSLTPLPPAAKAPRKRSSKLKKTGPSVSDLILKAVSASKERSGVSLIAIKKALAAGGYDVLKNNARVNMAIRRLVTKGDLIQTKGTGASGSFKSSKKQVVAKKKKPAKKKPVTQAKKPATKKRKRAAVKKTTGVKKSPKKAQKKSSRVKKTKSPSKAKKPAARKARTTKAAKPKVAKRNTRAKAAVAL